MVKFLSPVLFSLLFATSAHAFDLDYFCGAAADEAALKVARVHLSGPVFAGLHHVDQYTGGIIHVLVHSLGAKESILVKVYTGPVINESCPTLSGAVKEESPLFDYLIAEEASLQDVSGASYELTPRPVPATYDLYPGYSDARKMRSGTLHN